VTSVSVVIVASSTSSFYSLHPFKNTFILGTGCNQQVLDLEGMNVVETQLCHDL
jgi:hypothetical protein